MGHAFVGVRIIQSGILDVQTENDLIANTIDFASDTFGWQNFFSIFVPKEKNALKKAATYCKNAVTYQQTSGIGLPTIFTSNVKSSPSMTVLLRNGFTNSGGSPVSISSTVDFAEKQEDLRFMRMNFGSDVLTFHIQSAFRTITTMNVLSQTRVCASIIRLGILNDQLTATVIATGNLDTLAGFQFHIIFQPEITTCLYMATEQKIASYHATSGKGVPLTLHVNVTL